MNLLFKIAEERDFLSPSEEYRIFFLIKREKEIPDEKEIFSKIEKGDYRIEYSSSGRAGFRVNLVNRIYLLILFLDGVYIEFWEKEKEEENMMNFWDKSRAEIEENCSYYDSTIQGSFIFVPKKGEKE